MNTTEQRCKALSTLGIKAECKGDVTVLRGFVKPDTLAKLQAFHAEITDWQKMSATNADSLNNETALKYFLNTTNLKDMEMDKEIYLLTYDILNTYAILYPYVRAIVKGDQQYRFNNYLPGRGYYAHVDQHSGAPVFKERLVSCVIQLNSDYEGGILEFPQQGLEIKLETGDVALFPAGYTHPHSVSPVTSGSRKNIVTWFV